jgi:hypothetical protein
VSRIIVARFVILRLFVQRIKYDQRIIIPVLGKERVLPEDIHTRLKALFGDATDNEWSVRPWCQYARQGREDLHDEVRSGRPSIDFLDIQILALLDEQPFHSIYSVAEALGLSDSTILSHSWESFGMKISFTLDPARVNNQFATDSDGNLPKVIAYSQDPRER